MRFQCELVSISAGFGGISGVRNGWDLVQNAPSARRPERVSGQRRTVACDAETSSA